MPQWIVFKILQNGGTLIGIRRQDIYMNPDEIILYGPCNESEANEYYSDVRKTVIKPMQPQNYSEDDYV